LTADEAEKEDDDAIRNGGVQQMKRLKWTKKEWMDEEEE
jgi:hypothetical protein